MSDEAQKVFTVSIPQSHLELTQNQLKTLPHAVKINSLTSSKDILIFTIRFFKFQEKKGIISEIVKKKINKTSLIHHSAKLSTVYNSLGLGFLYFVCVCVHMSEASL